MTLTKQVCISYRYVDIERRDRCTKVQRVENVSGRPRPVGQVILTNVSITFMTYEGSSPLLSAFKQEQNMQVYPFNKTPYLKEFNSVPTEISDALVREWEDVKGKDDMLVTTLERLIEVHDDKYEFNYRSAEERTKKTEFLLSEEIDRLREYERKSEN